ncbi:MAG TPA: ATP-binding protein [Blastocatellia bacterium]|nr:ATP-binding protein [Blastocatellia bacterium]
MSDKVKFLMTFRARLMLLLTSFLLLTIVLVIALDNWASKRAEEVIAEQNKQITDSVNSGYGDLAEAMSMALQSLDSDNYLYQVFGPEKMPRTVESITVTERDGKVSDSTVREIVDKYLPVPEAEELQVWSVDPVMGEDHDHEHSPKTYYNPITTTKGLHWIIIVTTQETLINEIHDASKRLASSNRELSDYRQWATSGLLMLALIIAVFIGWRFTRPINELAGAARRVAAGDLDFRVNINRPDEVGQLASTFNEMIAGLKSKRELEEKLNQSERAAVIGRLTQAVAHEIRNPLNVINLSIDHVSSRYAPEDEARRQQFTRILSSIKDEIARLKHLVNDLLNYGRPAQLALQQIDMRDLVEETMTLVRPQADDQGVEITVEQEDEPAEVKGDRERLKSCLSNIAINALQAMPAGGHLTTQVHRRNGLVEVSITDTGEGISEEAIAKIFEPYFSTKKSGFGLGLAVTKKIVDDHKGSIDVQSQVDGGTTFTVKLPAIKAD